MLLQLEAQAAGPGFSQLQHSLQIATRALRAGASEELILAALS
jgi:predicted HD phosphohydrolase